MAADRPGAGTIVLRGFRRRCGRCGARDIFDSWFKLRERCPVCGYCFVREAGAFTGVMLVNVAATFTLMISSLFAYVFWRGITGADVSIWPFAAACLALAVLVPLVFHPFASSGWAAIDLAMRPLDDDEIRDAADHRAP